MKLKYVRKENVTLMLNMDCAYQIVDYNIVKYNWIERFNLQSWQNIKSKYVIVSINTSLPNTSFIILNRVRFIDWCLT